MLILSLVVDLHATKTVVAGAATVSVVAAGLVAAAPPERRRAAMLSVTVVSGFASSIFPLTGLLVANVGWRVALLILAALLAVTTVPTHAWAVPGSSRGRPTVTSGRRGMPPAVHDPGFWLTSAAFVVHSAAGATMSLLGVLSVTGRVLTTGL